VYRAGLFTAAGVLFALVLFLGLRDYSVTAGSVHTADIRRYTCGSTIRVVFFDEYAPEIEGPYLTNSCYISARDRTVTHGFFVLVGLGALIGGLVRGPAPPVKSIYTLAPLPTLEEMNRRWHD